jgi:hypothetical protein
MMSGGDFGVASVEGVAVLTVATRQCDSDNGDSGVCRCGW